MAEETTIAGTNQPNLLDCDALMLSSYLLHHRFNNNAMETASFLLEATSTLPNAEAISAQLMGEEQQEEVTEATKGQEAVAVDDQDTNDSNAKTKECTVSMTTPRGKFQMTLLEQGIRCVNAKNQVLKITPQAVERIIMFPKPEDCRKTSSGKVAGEMVLVCLEKSTTTRFNDKTLTQVCLQLPSVPPVLVKGDGNSDSWLQVLTSCLNLNVNTEVAIVQNPKNMDRSRYSFQSHDEGTTSSTTAGMPFVQCYHGVKDGVLYPMEEGLLFFKPPLFLHRSTLHSIACGRGSGGSRYVDLNITLEDESPVEFTNIHRDEQAHLNTYIHSTLIPAMKRDAISQEEDDDNEKESSSAVDEPSEASNGAPLGKRKRTQRKASREAREATKAHMERNGEEDSDEDDDEGWVGRQGDEESSSDEEDDQDEAADGAMEVDDNDEEGADEEFFEEQEDSGTATESDDDGD